MSAVILKFPRELPDQHIDALAFERWALKVIRAADDTDALKVIAEYGEMMFAKGQASAAIEACARLPETPRHD